MAVTCTKKEFHQFWEDVFGAKQEWYILEWDMDDEDYDHAGPGDPVTFSFGEVAWQGGPEGPQVTDWLTRSWYNKPGLDMVWLFEKWRAKQTTVSLLVEVPSENEAKFRELVAELGVTFPYEKS